MLLVDFVHEVHEVGEVFGVVLQLDSLFWRPFLFSTAQLFPNYPLKLLNLNRPFCPKLSQQPIMGRIQTQIIYHSHVSPTFKKQLNSILSFLHFPLYVDVDAVFEVVFNAGFEVFDIVAKQQSVSGGFELCFCCWSW